MSWRSGSTACSAATDLASVKTSTSPYFIVVSPARLLSTTTGTFQCLLFEKPSLHRTKGVIKGVFSPLSKSYNRIAAPKSRVPIHPCLPGYPRHQLPPMCGERWLLGETQVSQYRSRKLRVSPGRPNQALPMSRSWPQSSMMDTLISL